MRINKPQLFNGQYLASNDAILSAFFGANGWQTGQEVFSISDATIKDSLINWSVVDADFITGKVNGSNIKISAAADAATIKTYIDNAVASVRTYEVSGDTYVSAAKTEADGNVKYTLTTDTAAIAKAISGSVIDAAAISIQKSADSDLVYTLNVNGKAAGQINIPEDQFLESGVYDTEKRALVLTFKVDKDGEPGIDTVEIPVSGLIKEFTAGSGIVLNDTVFSGVVDSASESFLTVGAAGFKLTGVQDAINAASGNALTEAKAYSDLVSGAAYNQIVVTSGAIIDYVDAASGVLVSDISDALTSAKAYTDEVSGNLDTAIKAAAAAAAQDTANALTSAKAYTDEVSAVIVGTEAAVSGDLNLYGVKAYVDAKTEGIATDADTALGELQEQVTEISGKVTDLDTNKVNVTEKGIYTWSDFETKPAGGYAVSGLYVDVEGQTKFWNGTDFVATSEEVVDTIEENTADTAVPSVAAVSAFVDAKAEAVADVAAKAVAEVKTAVETAVTFVEVSGDLQNGVQVPGRVIAVYDAAGVCYPTITYAAGQSSITADVAESWPVTVIYAKKITVPVE